MHICIKCGTSNGDNTLEYTQLEVLPSREIGQIRIMPSRVLCEECHSEAIEVDENIVEIVLLLNQRGYETLFSCEGHRYSNGVDEAYISMHDVDKTFKDNFMFLPDEFHNHYITCEECSGPKSVKNRETIDKFVLRFPYKNININVTNFEYRKDKVNFYTWLYKTLEISLKDRKK